MNPSTNPPENIVLIGFMGCGKSTVGRELQQRLGYPLVDMDQVIEQRAGKPITAIFADDGEPAFRDMETALLRELNDPGRPAADHFHRRRRGGPGGKPRLVERPGLRRLAARARRGDPRAHRARTAAARCSTPMIRPPESNR